MGAGAGGDIGSGRVEVADQGPGRPRGNGSARAVPKDFTNGWRGAVALPPDSIAVTVGSSGAAWPATLAA